MISTKRTSETPSPSLSSSRRTSLCGRRKKRAEKVELRICDED